MTSHTLASAPTSLARRWEVGRGRGGGCSAASVASAADAPLGRAARGRAGTRGMAAPLPAGDQSGRRWDAELIQHHPVRQVTNTDRSNCQMFSG